MSSAARLEEMVVELEGARANRPAPGCEMDLHATGTDGPALRQVASERLAEHRRRRAAAQANAQAMEVRSVEQQTRRRGGTSRVREAVAARYQNSVSYREFLAQEAERALQQAQAEADAAARKAQAAAEAQMQLLGELEQWESAPGPRELAMTEIAAQTRDELAHAMADIALAATEAMRLQPRVEYAAATETGAASLTVRLYEELAAARTPLEDRRRHVREEADEHEATALDDEIAFRLAPEFEHQPAEPVTVSGNLIAFPRQLVATRKARPRLAEGPLRDESPGEPQLRIFEVEPEQISAEAVDAGGAPEWQGILLEGASAAEAPAVVVEPHLQFTTQPQTAPLELRLMAAAVDACCIGAALLAFVALVAEISGPRLRALPLPVAGASAGGVLLALFVAFQLLFFTLAEATPGMRYARIALCTFGDANPPRAAMRRRVVATLLAACPLGLGLAWAWMDDDGLGWHDKMSRMYQRAY